MPYVYLNTEEIQATLALAGLPWPLQIKLEAARRPLTSLEHWLIQLAREQAEWTGADVVVHDDAPVLQAGDGDAEVMAWLKVPLQDLPVRARPVETQA